MYTYDLALIMLNLMSNKHCEQVYNIGSNEAITIEALAKSIKSHTGSTSSIIVANKDQVSGSGGNIYVPSTEKAHKVMNWGPPISLESSIKRCAQALKLSS
jgi:nucleoside-diphosphate-sugar epimerase